jgi:hypothetical protein
VFKAYAKGFKGYAKSLRRTPSVLSKI